MRMKQRLFFNPTGGESLAFFSVLDEGESSRKNNELRR